MSEELRFQVGFNYVKGVKTVEKALETYYLTVAGTRPSAPTVQVGIAEEDLSFGDVGTPGFLWLRNLDATNFVTWGKKVAGSMEAVGLLLPTAVETIMVPPTIIYLASAAVTIRWIADTAACDVEVFLFPA